MAAFTQADLDALELAIASGQLEVRIGDRKVVYRSLKEMLEIRTMVRSSLGVADDAATPTRRYLEYGRDDTTATDE